VVVAASAAAAELEPECVGGWSPGGPTGVAGALRAARPQLAGVLQAGSGGAGPGGASQQRSRVHEQCVADAPVAASDAQSVDAGPEAAVLEHAGVSREEAERALSVWALAVAVASLRLLELAPRRDEPGQVQGRSDDKSRGPGGLT